MAVMPRTAAFDAVAPVYAEDVQSNPLLEGMRARARQALVDRVAPGSRVLELGCGPGIDAVWFAQRGYEVAAIDASPSMVEQTRWLAARASVGPRVRTDCRRIEDLHAMAPAIFDAVYSSLGPLNCVEDVDAAASLITARLRPGGFLVITVMGRLCPWEWLRFGAMGQWSRAGLRLRRGQVPVPIGRFAVATRYFTPGELTAPFARRGLRRVLLRSLGLCAPPPYLTGFVERHPHLVRALLWIDERVGTLPVARSCGDHLLTVFRKDVVQPEPRGQR